MLTAKGKYSLKALVHLAGLKPGETAQAVAIAEAHNIPKKFLDAILGDLRAAGIVYDVAGLFFFVVIVIGAWPVLVANAHIKTATGLYMNVLYGSFAVAGLLCIPALLDSLAHRLGWSGSGPPQPPSNRPLGGAMS